ncbi:lysosomal proton-coupled steroid conjugate and bile acid symporter SLC46A3-like [Brevipalpus obovatus]|uniref:lysosomal proton-coupled steroid conjugate and bile acid symporter SLC46A3-like n=1 Tax=Brevipalpus obovatus TaxID=246614 RepID=UPI003D9F49F7
MDKIDTPKSEHKKFRSLADVKNFAISCLLDVHVFLFAFSVAITNITSMQIIQDKVCVNDLRLSPEICHNIEKRPGYSKQADHLYRKATEFRMYEGIMIWIPSMMVTLFIGKLLDKYPQLLKVFFLAPLVGITIHCFLVIYNAIYFELDYHHLYWAKLPFGLFGSTALLYSASYTYVLRYTPKEFREIRFGMIDFAFNLGITTSMAVGGSILTVDPWFYPRLRNYIGVYGVSALGCILAILWIIFVVQNSTIQESPSTENGKEEKIMNDDKPSESIFQQTSAQKTEENSKFTPLKNIVQMVKTCAKKREDGNHIRLWWCLVCVCLSQICLYAEFSVVYQFVQKVYGWDAQYFSNLKTVVNLIPTFGAIIFPVILVNKMKLSDTTIGIIGSYSLISSCLIKGGFLFPVAFYIGEVASMFTEMMSISFRTIAAKLISFDEYGQVFTVLSCMQSSAGMSSSLLFTGIFNNTINFYPGMVYHAVALTMFMPYLVLIWIDLSGKRLENRKRAAKAKQTIKLEQLN